MTLPTISSTQVTDFCDMVQSYWQVVFKRFVDYVAQALDEAFLKDLESKTMAELSKRLIGDTDDVREGEKRSAWFKPSKDLQRQMDELGAKRERLQQGMKVVNDYIC